MFFHVALSCGVLFLLLAIIIHIVISYYHKNMCLSNLTGVCLDSRAGQKMESQNH